MQLYMSYAAFVFYAKKYGFEFQKHKGNSLTFNYSGGRYYFSKIMEGKRGVDCGYIVVNSDDFMLLFGKDEDYLKDINNSAKIKTTQEEEHCHLPSALWGKIETEVSPGEFINCQRRFV